ncbi:NfeD-like partner-binding protein [Geothermobacter ehrlichii]|uniref:NfeD-like partner-binding protein n=1 Tax=Geothermobacter ehrlichii TaxID=213224 RepID=A0A5D3WNI1_9BACT|nr:NfeD family protein [Geothermobacter ehrlichii]TYO98919.1 NfeD-like partner-binding protein [Geothermobacter ehrlichii]
MKRLAGCRRQTFVKYALLQIPGTLLLVLVLLVIDRFTPLPSSWFWGILLLWLAKEAVLFPLTWRSYQSETAGAEPPVGRTAEVIVPLDPEGTVRVGGELWQARCRDGGRIGTGEQVRILAREGMMLQVERKEDSSR